MYRLSEEAPTRVSGRASHVVAVEPLDDLRYGYRVWIDDASAMPLKTQLRASDGRIVEQLVFTELSLRARIPDAALLPAVVARDYRWLRHAAPTSVTDSQMPAGNWGPPACPRVPPDGQFDPDPGRCRQGRDPSGLQRWPGLRIGVRGAGAAPGLITAGRRCAGDHDQRRLLKCAADRGERS